MNRIKKKDRKEGRKREKGRRERNKEEKERKIYATITTHSPIV